jgi:hypothetical protein
MRAMLSMSCCENLIEITFASTRRITMDRAGLSAVSMIAERQACGRIGHALLVLGAGAEPVRIDGGADEIGALHQVLMDMLVAASAAQDCGARVH